MIVPMKKVSVVVLNSERKESLKKLRKIGLIHLEEVEGKGPVLAAYKEASANADKAISILDEYGFDRFLLNSDISNKPSDPLSVPKTIRELMKLGYDKEDIEKISHRNAQKFFNI